MLKFFLFVIFLQQTSVHSFLEYYEEQVGVVIELEIKHFSNQYLELPDDMSCNCPIGQNCSVRCRVQFSMIYIADDGDVKNLETDFFTLDRDGELGQQEKYTYAQNFRVDLEKKPAFVKIIANTLGSWIKADGESLILDSFPQSEQFVIPFKNVTPSRIDKHVFHENEYHGRNHGASLSLSFKMQCLSFLIGPMCDLKCMRHKNNNESAICLSVTTGDHFICKQMENYQVDGCEKVPWTYNNSTFEMNDQEEKQCVESSSQSIVIEWKMISIAIAILLLSVTLAFLMGFKISSISADQKKKKGDSITVAHIPLSSV